MRTVIDVLNETVAAHGDRDAYVIGEDRISYTEFDRRSRGFAAALHGFGVGRGDVVCLLVPSSIEFAVCYLAAMRLGAVTSAVNPRLGPHERTSIAERTSPVVTIAPDAGYIGPEWGRIVRFREVTKLCSTPPLFDEPSVDRNDVVAIVWTSGTTGLPKGAMYDHAAMEAIHTGMGPLCVAGDRRVVSLPFAHVGYMTHVWNDIAHAVTMVLVSDPWTAEEQIELVDRERITMMTGVPTQWSKMLAHPRLAEIDLSRLRLAGCGGAEIPAELVREMRQRLGCAVMARYTSTEAGLATSTQLNDDEETIASTVGVPSSVVEMRIVNSQSDAIVANGEVGEIRLRSPAMFTGYWHDAEQTRLALDDDGFLRTGDLGYVGVDGNLRIVGRLKDMYIRGGYNVYPAEIESVLSEHPSIAASAVVGAAVPVIGEIGVAFIVLNDNAPSLTLTEVRDWCRSQLADYKSPERVVFVSELPINAMHKIDKQPLREQAKEYV